MASYEVGEEVEIEGRLYTVIDESGYVFVYSSSTEELRETNVMQYYLQDEHGNLFRLEVPFNGDKNLQSFTKVDQASESNS